MQTDLPRAFLETGDGARAEEILRSCVHCGFCNATCPTYQLLGDELDGPRGRIYLIKEMLERDAPDEVTRTHLDRCLTCRACETTCPSGVRYGELLELGRNYLEEGLARPVPERWIRRWLLAVVPRPGRLRHWLALGRRFRWLLPSRLAAAVPRGTDAVAKPPHRPPPADTPNAAEHDPAVPSPSVGPGATHPGAIRRVVLLNGCVQGVATPQVNATLAALLVGHGIEVVQAPGEVCCGSLALHLGAAAEARATMAANVDALARALDGADAVVSTASGCGVTVKEYDRLLGDDASRCQAAARVAARTLDAAELVHRLGIQWRRHEPWQRVAWHSPCTLQHGQQVRGLVEPVLEAAGYQLVPAREPHLCCGAAGTYSILQPELAGSLRVRKLESLQQHQPDVIATANVGCQLHLAEAARVPVVHWLELLR